MPQLDALTYFSQYIYLLLSFVASYVFVLRYIIPYVVSALKLRQKLNSIAHVTSKLNASETSQNATLYACHSNLVHSNWYACSKVNLEMPVYAKLQILTHALKLKKVFTYATLVPYK